MSEALLETIIQTLGTILVAIISVVLTKPKKSEPAKTQNIQSKPSGWAISGLIAGIVAVVTFFALGFVLDLVFEALRPTPTVTILSPKHQSAIQVRVPEARGGYFTVSGTATSMTSDPELRVYVLVHPVEPFAAGWWIQPPITVHTDGSWDSQTWIGDRQHLPEAGDIFEIAAIVVNAQEVAGVAKVDDLKDILAIVQSDIVRLTIDSVETD